MEPLIYYPKFEPPNEIWLKFALLYFDQFKPIVPYGKQHLITDNFQRIIDNTDLVELYSPGYNESYRATLNAIEETEKILSQPFRRSYLFKSINLHRSWQEPINWNFEIFHEKFSDEWIDFCIENKIGCKTNDGILVAEELAFLFMTHLAKEISFSTSASIVTDDNKFDNFTSFRRAFNPKFETRNQFAKSIINLQVPRNISQISIERLIKFRNEHRELLTAFNSELENVQHNISNGYSSHEFISSFNRIYGEFNKEVVLLGLGVLAIPFATYLLITNKAAMSAEYIKEMLSDAAIFIGGSYSIRKSLFDNKSKRYCKKYLTNLRSL